ncbi:MAG TPA: TrbG/VirB9 family P-type conjugative transfer protein [Allosphingosinicella sp.]|nr:TrbG/VirB9 family P-type conjugative transfer protein [Allosphingosinicella sp.]
MIRPLLFLAGAALAWGPAEAQIRPQSDPGGDPRLQSIAYAANQVILLEGSPGYHITIELSPDERIETVAVGDSSAWQVTANRRGDLLFVKALTGGVSTNMTAITNVRTYNFELVPVSSTQMAYTVRFLYPPPPTTEEELADATAEGRYRLGGDHALRPSGISDDGVHTYIRWPRDRALPAVYAVTDAGEEMLVNGMMREDDLFVIDSVSRKLVFRIDDSTATATRQKKKAR